MRKPDDRGVCSLERSGEALVIVGSDKRLNDLWDL